MLHLSREEQQLSPHLWRTALHSACRPEPAGNRIFNTSPGADLSPGVAFINPTRVITVPGTVSRLPSIFTSDVMLTGLSAARSCAHTSMPAISAGTEG